MTLQATLKKKYTLKDLYFGTVLAFRSLPVMIRNRRKPVVDAHWIERLMLATTEVNGCDVCSYAHTQMALKEGFSPEEIEAFLSGSAAYVKAEEATSILYAQHVADTMGHPDPVADRTLIETYGSPQATVIRSAIHLMMMGNMSGIPLSALLRRLKGRPYQNSGWGYEVGLLAVQPLVFLIAPIHALLDGWLFHRLQP